MDFFELKAFVSVARNLHFSQAASEINLSPSALSRLISRLEDEAGAELFDRSRKEVLLTEKGKAFLAFASRCIKEKENLENEFSSCTDTVCGTLHVYASVTACYTIMPPFIKRLSAEYPLVHLSVETGDPAGAVCAVREGRAEIAVAAIPDNRSMFFNCISVCRSPLVFAAAVNSPYVDVQGSPQDIVSTVPLILPKAGLARRRFDSWIKSRNVRPEIAAETEGNEAVMALAALGLGIGLVPQIVLENGPYREGFVSHSAGNALGFYDIGFIQKAKVPAAGAARRMRLAVDRILQSSGYKVFH
ncbi:LysR substrate-binding domain-containing protein [Treponema sp.]|uniref:LysR substrate-binding domain-containing protein n=1 Tax=Treponema sp. TaxID=166 RepID=UPI003F0576EE